MIYIIFQRCHTYASNANSTTFRTRTTSTTFMDEWRWPSHFRLISFEFFGPIWVYGHWKSLAKPFEFWGFDATTCTTPICKLQQNSARWWWNISRLENIPRWSHMFMYYVTLCICIIMGYLCYNVLRILNPNLKIDHLDLIE